jgi:hypothetical protein
MEFYDGLKLIHVLAAMFLIGTIPFDYLLVRRVLAARDPSRIAKTLDDLEWVENRIAIPTAGFLLLSGLLMSWGPWARWSLFGAPWFPTVGLGLLVVMLIVFAAILPAKYKAIRAWANGGSQAQMPAKDWQAWSFLGMALGLTVVYFMVVRPF